MNFVLFKWDVEKERLWPFLAAISANLSPHRPLQPMRTDDPVSRRLSHTASAAAWAKHKTTTNKLFTSLAPKCIGAVHLLASPCVVNLGVLPPPNNKNCTMDLFESSCISLYVEMQSLGLFHLRPSNVLAPPSRDVVIGVIRWGPRSPPRTPSDATELYFVSWISGVIMTERFPFCS